MNERIIIDYVDSQIGIEYSQEWMKKVLRSSTKEFNRVLRLGKDGKTSRNRSTAKTEPRRKINKTCGQQKWFKLEEEEADQGNRNPGKYIKGRENS